MNSKIAFRSSHLSRRISRLLAVAQRAGEAFGTRDQDNAYAQLILLDGLDDDQRERLGFATHMIGRAKQTGVTPIEVWRYIQDSFSYNQRGLSSIDDADEVELGVLAYSIGVCYEDESVCRDIRSYLAYLTSDRVAGSGLSLAWARS